MTRVRGGRLRRLAAPVGLALLVLAFAPTASAADAADAASAATSISRASSTTICVGVVVDYEGLQSTEPSPNSYCARVPAGSTGTEILDARARALHLPAPTFLSSGLLCQIDGVPAASVCNTENGNGGFNYWSYWNRPAGAAGWTYGREGPSSYEPGNGAQEGWTWVEGQSEADAPRPPLLSEAVVCPSTTPTPTPSPSLSATAPSSTGSPSTTPLTTSAPASTRTVLISKSDASATAPTSSAPTPSATHNSSISTPAPSAGTTSTTRSVAAVATSGGSPGADVTHLVATASAGGVRPAAATAWIAGVALIVIIGAASWWRSRSP